MARRVRAELELCKKPIETYVSDRVRDADLGAQLPLLIRGLYFEGWVPSGKLLKERKKE